MQRIAIVGAGLMGRGIAQLALLAGLQVRLYDARWETTHAAQLQLQQTLQRLQAQGKLSASEVEAALSRLELAEHLSALSDSQLVIEAIVENLELKRALLQQLEAVVDAQCILASNTSSLSISALAAACQQPQRVAGLHFFSPVPLMKVVEIIDSVLTAPSVTEQLQQLVQRLGHTPVRAQDTPGFIVNHAGRGYLTESLRVLSEAIACPASIDRVLKAAAGFRLGPFELLDLTGLDVSLPVMESIYQQYYHEPRYRPVVALHARRAAGLLGRKTGRGFYHYLDGQLQAPTWPTPPAAPKQLKVWISADDHTIAQQVATRLQGLGAWLDTADRPAADAVCVLLPWGDDLTTAALAQGLDPSRCFALDPLLLGKQLCAMRNPASAAQLQAALWGLLASDGSTVTWIQDSPGFIAQRVLAMVVNIACDMAQQRVATPQDIERAVTLGLGYPRGPLALGDALGPLRVVQILRGLQRCYGDPRYRPSPWLTRRARLGLSLLASEGELC